MIFATIRDVARLERELKTAQERVVSLEEKLEGEREARLDDNQRWADRFLQKQGVFGIKQPSVAPRTEPKKNDLPRLTAIEEATLAGFEEEAVKAGRPVTDGTKLFYKLYKGIPSDVELPESDFNWTQTG